MWASRAGTASGAQRTALVLIWISKRAQISELFRSGGTAMFDGLPITLTQWRSDAPHAAETLPWQLVGLLICFAALSAVLAILYPDVFGAPLQQF
jgi:hypothetical protein